MAASPLHPGRYSQDAEQPGCREARTRRGVATARIVDLMLEGVQGREMRQQRSRADPPAWPIQSSAVAADASTRFQTRSYGVLTSASVIVLPPGEVSG